MSRPISSLSNITGQVIPLHLPLSLPSPRGQITKSAIRNFSKESRFGEALHHARVLAPCRVSFSRQNSQMVAIATRLSRSSHRLLKICSLSRPSTLTSFSHDLQRLSTRAVFCSGLKGHNEGHRNITSSGSPSVDIRYSVASLRPYSTETPPPTRRENTYTIPNLLTTSCILAGL
jgi:hypothetical protein